MVEERRTKEASPFESRTHGVQIRLPTKSDSIHTLQWLMNDLRVVMLDAACPCVEVTLRMRKERTEPWRVSKAVTESFWLEPGGTYSLRATDMFLRHDKEATDYAWVRVHVDIAPAVNARLELRYTLFDLTPRQLYKLVTAPRGDESASSTSTEESEESEGGEFEEDDPLMAMMQIMHNARSDSDDSDDSGCHPEEWPGTTMSNRSLRAGHYAEDNFLSRDATLPKWVYVSDPARAVVCRSREVMEWILTHPITTMYRVELGDASRGARQMGFMSRTDLERFRQIAAFLHLYRGRLPADLTAEEAAWVMDVRPDFLVGTHHIDALAPHLLRLDGKAIRLVQTQTEELCRLALRQTPDAAHFIHVKNE